MTLRQLLATPAHLHSLAGFLVTPAALLGASPVGMVTRTRPMLVALLEVLADQESATLSDLRAVLARAHDDLLRGFGRTPGPLRDALLEDDAAETIEHLHQAVALAFSHPGGTEVAEVYVARWQPGEVLEDNETGETLAL